MLVGETPVPYLLAKKRLRTFSSSRLVTVEQAVDFAWQSSPHASIRPLQVKEEVTELLKILSAKRPHSVLEIGTANGGTLFLFAQVAAPDATIMSLDYPWVRYSRWRSFLFEGFAKYSTQRIITLRANSHNRSTLDEVLRRIPGMHLDYLFIDGDHTYNGVRLDFEMYSPLVSKGGLVALHDIVKHPPESHCGVSRFWSELKSAYDYKELVKDPAQGWGGIGLIWK